MNITVENAYCRSIETVVDWIGSEVKTSKTCPFSNLCSFAFQVCRITCPTSLLHIVCFSVTPYSGWFALKGPLCFS